MAKLNLGGGKALEQVRAIIKEIEQLKATSNTSGKATAAVFSRLESTLKNMEAAAIKGGEAVKKLTTAASTNNNALSEWAKLLARLEQAQERMIIVNTAENQALQALNANLAKANKLHKDAANAVELEAKARLKGNEERIKEADRIASNISALDRQRQAALKLAEAERNLNTAYNQLKEAARAAIVQAKEIAAQHGVNSEQAKKAAEAARELVKQLKEIDKSTKVASSSMKGSFSGVLIGFQSLISAFGVVGGMEMFASIVKDAFELVKTFDGISFALSKIAVDAEQAAMSFRFLNGITTDFGVELIATSTRWIKFLAAAKQSGLTLLETEKIFGSMTKAAGVLGLKTDELSGVYLALEQMLSKGKVTTEELRRQLGERLPGAFGIMAASMGVTMQELDKMLKKGQVLSAEVLPEFARAVELAYGIDSVTKVDTLVAAQSRLSNAWSKFIISITKGSTALKDFFNDMATGYEFYIRLFGDAEQKRELIIAERTKIFEKNMFEAAKKRYDEELALGSKFWNVKERMEKSQAAVRTNRTTKNYELRDKALKEQADKDIKVYLDYIKVIDGYQKEYANEQIVEAAENFKVYSAMVRTQNQIIAEEEAKGFGTGGLVTVTSDRLESAKKLLKVYENEIVNATVKYNTFLKLTEVNTEDADKNEIQRLKEVSDEEEKIAIGNLKRMIEFNKRSIESDETTYAEKVELADDNRSNMIGIAMLEYSLANAARKKAHKDELEDKAKTYAEGKYLKSEYDAWLKSVELQNTTNAELLLQDRNAKIAQAEEAFFNDSIKLRQANQDRQVALTKQTFDKQIANANVLYELDKEILKAKGASQKELEFLKTVHEEKIKRISIESANAQIRTIIVLLEAERALMVARGENVEALDIQINALLAAIKSLEDTSVSTDEMIKLQKEALSGLLEMANEFSQAIGDVISAQFDRRIEFINAEIEAEKNKYDELIKLAGDDQENKLALEQQRDARVKILEAKRLKEQQKQAKIQKAFAVADIAMKLGQTIIAINLAAAAQDVITPFAFGSVGAIYRSLQIPFAIATSVAQIAAVLSAPIPQFAEGGTMKKTGKALINDGGQQEYVERNGKLLTTTSTNALVALKAGDIVHKDYDSMVKNSMAMSGLFGGVPIKQNEFNAMFDGIEKSIEKGFGKAKINNNIKLNNMDNNNSYRDSLSRWN